jgi:uncharacterized protein
MTGPVDVRRSPYARLRPLAGTIDGGYWDGRRRLNREVLLRDAPERLEAAGNLDDLRAAAGLADVPFRGMVFMDSDVYKWLEAVGWEPGTPQRDAEIALVEAAQEDGGYLNSYYQVEQPRERFSNPAWDHELYCAGHLMQAAVAQARGRGDERLLGVALRFAELLWQRFGPDGEPYTPGHPEIETALVELYRHTGDERWLTLARRLVDHRGQGSLQPATHGSSYFQDRVPVREQPEIEGHAVRALYLNAGVTDLYLETGEPALLEAMEVQWRDMAAGKTYLTGGVGAHHMDEAFGDAYELPPDRCYGETCAAIASVQWNWRMLLVTGESRYADLLERTLFNAVMAGLALDGGGYSYVNPLHVRDDHRDPVERGAQRRHWYACACCPPNIMRLLASLPHYLATYDDGGVQVHQYASATLGPVRVRTDYPWDGRVEVEVLEARDAAWTLSLRVPAWSRATTVDGEPVEPGGYVRLRRDWRAGDRVVLELDMAPRVVYAHPRIDAIRGCAAIERGPLVYCVEAADAPRGARVDDLRLDPRGALRAVWRGDLLGGVMVVAAAGEHHPVHDDAWPYGASPNGSVGRPVELTAVPYSHWGNRGPGGMRVWIPVVEAPVRTGAAVGEAMAG